MFFLGVGTAIIGAASKNIGLTPSQIGILIAFQNLGFIFSVLIMGALADTHSKPLLLFIGSIILAGSFLFYYMRDSFTLNLMIMFFIGIGIGTYEGVTDAFILDIHTKRQETMVTINHFFVTFGSLMISFYLIFLQMNWRRSMLQSAVIVGILGLVFLFVQSGKKTGTSTGILERYKILGKEKVLFILFAAAVCSVSIEVIALGIFTSFLMDLRGFTQITSKVGLVVFLCGIAAGRFVLGLIAKKEGLVKIITLLFGINVVVSSILYFVHLSSGVLYVFLFIYGANVSVLLPLLITLAGLRFKDMAGTAMSFIKLGIPVSGIVMPLILSLISEQISFQASLFLFPIAGFAGFLLFLISGKGLKLPDAVL